MYAVQQALAASAFQLHNDAMRRWLSEADTVRGVDSGSVK